VESEYQVTVRIDCYNCGKVLEFEHTPQNLTSSYVYCPSCGEGIAFSMNETEIQIERLSHE